MSANGLNTSEDADMTDCEGENVVTMMDVLQEQQDFEDDANAVLGASDEKDCTYSKGYIKRQAVYACLTCCNEAKDDPGKRAGVCLACSLNCHENHELVELYTKRNFRCDCGNPKFGSHPCTFTDDKTEVNEDNLYNQNFSGIYCVCHRPYPDPENPNEDEMIQCVICEDWLHASHLEATVPANEQFAEMVCKGCMEKNDFLNDYSGFAVNNDECEDVDIMNGSVKDDTLNNGDVDHKVNSENDSSKVAVDKDVEMAKPEEEQTITSENVEDAKSTDNEQNEIVDKVRNEEIDNKNIGNPENAMPPTETEKPEESANDKTIENINEGGITETEHEKPLESDKSECADTTTHQPDDAEKVEEAAASTTEVNTSTEKDETSPTEDQKEAPDGENADIAPAENIPVNKKGFSDEDQKEIDAIDQFLEESNAKVSAESEKNENEKVENMEAKTETKDIEGVDKDADGVSTDKTEDTEKAVNDQDEATPTNEVKEIDGSVKEIKSTETSATTDVEMKDDAKAEASDGIVSEAEPQTNDGSPKATEKRKLSTEESVVEDLGSKKAKFEDDIGTCTRPRGPKKQFKGATFWPSNFRQKLCTCSVCISMYKDLSVLFLTDLEDTVTAYETIGKERTPTTQYEKGLQALSSLDRTVQINALTQYNDMKDRLLDYLKSFKDRQRIVKEEDIKAFFEGMKPKREPDGVYFCR